ncbi:hypothetical protein RFI_02584 [Reticulomyxa filosa]|uniref:Uncharacterized protein n=1 Tax=Reticulomyxa filosa TaxID=46433 RepID=X6P8I8_RETFI|nr:hypothetical protein RFI_02584 [Reticulomyxa filosa]|eukprot:ETO34511.1 hypothetical protein RFI_02584 [Reticulomyxa filosa]
MAQFKIKILLLPVFHFFVLSKQSYQDIFLDKCQNKEEKTQVQEETGGLDEEEQIELQLKSQDGLSFPVKKDIAMHSALIKTIWSGDKTETEIPLPNVRSSILKRVINFMEYHHQTPMKEIEKPLKSSNMREVLKIFNMYFLVVPEWDANFVEVDQETLFELILAANYMDIKPLLDLTCAKVASMLKGKTPEQIRKQFNIANDFTPEEEEAVRAENKWAEDS